MMVLAPGRFSITTGWPQSSLIFWPMRRAKMSLGPPAGKGTIIRIGRLGKPADGSWAMAASAQIASIAATRNRNIKTIGAPAGLFFSGNSHRCAFDWQPINTSVPSKRGGHGLERVPVRLNQERALDSLFGRIFFGKPVSTFPENALA